MTAERAIQVYGWASPGDEIEIPGGGEGDHFWAMFSAARVEAGLPEVESVRTVWRKHPDGGPNAPEGSYPVKIIVKGGKLINTLELTGVLGYKRNDTV